MTTTNGSNDYPPSIRIATLYRKKSKSGATYFSGGKVGNGRLSLVKSKLTTDEGEEIWNLLLSEMPQKQEEAQTATQQAKPSAPRRGIDKELDDQIPF